MRGEFYRLCQAATLTKGFVLQMLTRDLLAIAKIFILRNILYKFEIQNSNRL